MASRAWRHPHNAPRGPVGFADRTRVGFASSLAFVRRDRGVTVEPFVEALFGPSGPVASRIVGSVAGSSSVSAVARALARGVASVGGVASASAVSRAAAGVLGATSGSSSTSGTLSHSAVVGPTSERIDGYVFGSCLVRGTLRGRPERQIIASFPEAPMPLRRREIEVGPSGRKIDHAAGTDGGAWRWTGRMMPSVALALRTTRRRALVFRDLGTEALSGKLTATTAREAEDACLVGLAPLIAAGRIWDVRATATIESGGLSVVVSYRDAIGSDRVTI